MCPGVCSWGLSSPDVPYERGPGVTAGGSLIPTDGTSIWVATRHPLHLHLLCSSPIELPGGCFLYRRTAVEWVRMHLLGLGASFTEQGSTRRTGRGQTRGCGSVTLSTSAEQLRRGLCVQGLSLETAPCSAFCMLRITVSSSHCILSCPEFSSRT